MNGKINSVCEMIDCKTIKNHLEDYVTIWKTFT